MYARKSSRRNICKNDDSSFASTSSTSRVSSENSDILAYDAEDEGSSTNFDHDDDDDDIDSLQYKLECLKVTQLEKKLEHSILKRCKEVENVSQFINDLFSKKKSKDTKSEEQKRTIIQLYEKNRELSRRLKSISKKNKETTKEIFQLYVRVKELMEERKKVWDEAVKMHKLNLGDSSAFLDFDETDTFNESTFKEKEKRNPLLGIDFAGFRKTVRIVQVARILYNLIVNSEVEWSKNKKLLEILDCCSQMLDTNFDLKKHKEFMSIVDEVILRLNKVKM